MAHVPAERCLAIIELLADGARDMPLGEIAERLTLPKSGAHRLLATLVDLGWAERDPETGFYRLTMRLAILGQQFYAATGIPDVCQPLLDRLAAHSREFVRLAVVDTDALVWVAHAQGNKGGLMYQPSLASNTVPLYATASGKAWLATLPDSRTLIYTGPTSCARWRRWVASSIPPGDADTAWPSAKPSPASPPWRQRSSQVRPDRLSRQ